MKQTEEWNSTKSRIEIQIKELRHQLHICPEISGQERKSRSAIKRFLEENTHFELHDCGAGFYAACRSSAPEQEKKGIAFRADYDALALPEGGAAHLCGHDGHAAALCGVALLLEQAKGEGRDPGRDVLFLFQPAEETGAGAAPCCELFDKEDIEEIYGAHNLPGFAFGEIYTKEGTFACGSEGLTLRFTGKPTHAAYPELGVSPAPAVGQLLTEIPAFLDKKEHGYGGMALCTVIGVQMGEKAFGAAAMKAEVWLTLRAERGADLEKLRQIILTRAEELAAQDSLTLEAEEQDVFPATENDKTSAEKVLKACGGRILQEPMRWSEDFGHYLKHCRGAFFGIGAGADHPGLHTETYEYPDGLLLRTAENFLKLL
ncbi:amidohydrolase [Anaerosacchariphilus sp. NSJ-68]|uniref:Amidohydrolase n=2 Tax=Lachnospiraceae TaxID=186803 RepID=A0A923RLL8_9FIRM|nr:MULTISPECIES: amidohydrolase [Lachnospiraceae]MBC5659363.1 amidohydrolase [Anaerosacchariphilus hominis]MBC5697029.1 amidohydrolase [Roseburia difficilis]